MALEQAAREVLKKLIENGYKAYLVGGYVRDKYIGRDIHDIDIATSARPEQVVSLFERTVPTGLKHGTVTVLHRGYSFEVTTFRKEGRYSDSRRPDRVLFVSDIREDLYRRDFTMNAMAMDIEGNILDPFGGRADLDKKQIRTVGSAFDRFQEDALRMVRAIRFASQLGFSIEPKTWQALLDMSHLLNRIAVERIKEELDKWVKSAHPDLGYRLIVESRLFAFEPIINALFQSRYTSDVISLKTLTSRLLRWTALFVLTEKNPDQTKNVLRRLRFSGSDQKVITGIIELYLSYRMVEEMNAEQEKQWWKETLLDRGWETSLNLCRVLKALNRHHLDSKQLREWYESLSAKKVEELAVSGRDLIDYIGKEPGPWVSGTLRHLLYAVNFHALPNARDALLKEAGKENKP
ncbi:MAG: CCA tRNA nucleotidyltransferase [Bacillaceae bacterium]|nr:CCA tRNA nucleotidyltransferase [Bacillaceae bacterium]